MSQEAFLISAPHITSRARSGALGGACWPRVQSSDERLWATKHGSPPARVGCLGPKKGTHCPAALGQACVPF